MANDEHYTPSKFIDLAREVMEGIDLDPCSSEIANSIVEAENYFTIDDDCLSIDNWAHHVDAERPLNVFMNPPYSRAAGTAKPYVNKLIKQWENDYVKEAIILLNNSTANVWWRPLYKFPHCFVSPRISFLDKDLEVQGAPRYDNAFIYLYDRENVRQSIQKFVDVFSSVGNVMVKMYPNNKKVLK